MEWHVSYLNREAIMQLIPHREPILLVDNAVVYDSPKISGVCYLAQHEILFAGHFPGKPIFPGIYLQEALAQTAAILMTFAYPEFRGRGFVFATVEKVKFRRQVKPGEELSLEVELMSKTTLGGRTMARLSGQALVDEEIACEAVFTGYSL